MDKAEALFIAEQHIARLRNVPYAELKRRVEKHVRETASLSGPSGTEYQIEIEAVWDSSRAKGNIRLMVLVDDGGWRAFYSLTRSFIKSPDGSFVGE
jgi:hypothetical protein